MHSDNSRSMTCTQSVWYKGGWRLFGLSQSVRRLLRRTWWTNAWATARDASPLDPLRGWRRFVLTLFIDFFDWLRQGGEIVISLDDMKPFDNTWWEASIEVVVKCYAWWHVPFITARRPGLPHPKGFGIVNTALNALMWFNVSRLCFDRSQRCNHKLDKDVAWKLPREPIILCEVLLLSLACWSSNTSLLIWT